MKPFRLLVLLVLTAGCDNSGSRPSPDDQRVQPGPQLPNLAQRPPSNPTPPPMISVRHAVFSPDGRLLLIGYNNAPGRNPLPEAEEFPVYNMVSGLKVCSFPKKEMGSFALIPGTSHVLARSDDWSWKVWDMTNGKLVRELNKVPGRHGPFVLSPDGSLAIASIDDRPGLHLWSVKNGELLRTFDKKVKAIIFTPDSKRLFAAVVKDGQREEVIVWDVKTGEDVAILENKEDEKLPTAFSRDGKRAVSEGWDKDKPKEKNFLILWDTATGKEFRRFEKRGPTRWSNAGGRAMAAVFSLDDKHLITGDYDVVLRQWDVATGKQIYASEMEPDEVGKASLYGVFFSENGERAFTSFGCYTPGSTMGLKVWDCADGKIIRLLPQPRAND